MATVLIMAFLAASASIDSQVHLPEPGDPCGMTLAEAIVTRRSVRSYSEEPLTLQQLACLLFAAGGITSDRGFRAAPSAGATYPMTIYVVSERVQDLQPGIYEFHPDSMVLVAVAGGEFLDGLAEAALGQPCIRDCAAAVVLAARYSRTTRVYGDRGYMYVHMEAGHISQNIYLQAAGLGLGTVAVGAFIDEEVAELMRLEEDMTPLYIMPVGRI